jgi:HD-like signal output (HDOD) protein
MERSPLPGSLSELLDHITEVCPLPATAQRILALSNSDDSKTKEISEAISCDPAMAAQVLRIANSAIYARPRRVVDLQQALVTIGLDEVRNIAAAMALLAAFRSPEEISLELHAWSALSGGVARMIAAKFLPSWKGMTLVAGLLCEVGALACLAVDGEGYVELWRSVHNRAEPWTSVAVEARDQFERERYGYTSRAIGAKFLRRNMIPEEIASAIEAPTRSQRGPSPLGCITMFARRVAPLLVSVFESGDLDDLADQLHDLALATQLGDLDREGLRELCVAATVETELSQRKRPAKKAET